MLHRLLQLLHVGGQPPVALLPTAPCRPAMRLELLHRAALPYCWPLQIGMRPRTPMGGHGECVLECACVLIDGAKGLQPSPSPFR